MKHILLVLTLISSFAHASVTCTQRSSWPGGAVYDCVATIADVPNLPGAPSAWTASFAFGANIVQAWNVSIVDGEAGRKRLRGLDYNSTLAQPASFGFVADSEGALPSDFVLELEILPAVVTPTPPPVVVGPTPTPTPIVTVPLPRSGYFAARGSRIINSAGNDVSLQGISWFGLETSNYAPHGLWARSLKDLLAVVKSTGFNYIRVPFSDDIFNSAKIPNGIDFNLNPDLKGLTGLQILDRVVAGARAQGLRVMLDRHRPTASGQSELWYTSTVSEKKWIADWTSLARRYAGNTTVFAFDLHNEPHGAATWGDGAATDWRLAAERAGNAILKVNADVLIVVEGIEHVGNDWYWWGGNLDNAGEAPVRLNVPGRVVYSAHDYPASVYEQSWFSAPNYPANLPGIWRAHWGYLVEQGIAPVILGEFGTKLATQRDEQWLKAIVAYAAANHIPTAFWALNPNSGDTGGILESDWRTVDAKKLGALRPLFGK